MSRLQFGWADSVEVSWEQNLLGRVREERRVIQDLSVLEQCETAKMGPGRHLEVTTARRILGAQEDNHGKHISVTHLN